MTEYVYALVDPESFEPRYVGYTKNPERRLKQHLADKPDIYVDNWDKWNWLQLLKKRGLAPKMVIIARPRDMMGTFLESVWIRRYIDIGYDLFNHQAQKPVNYWFYQGVDYAREHPGWAEKHGYTEIVEYLAPLSEEMLAAAGARWASQEK